MSVKTGHPIILECRFLAEPQPNAIWFFKDAELKPDERISMTLDNKLAKLIILNANRSDSGSYILNLSNFAGSEVQSYKLVVSSVPKKLKGPIEVKDIKKY